MKGKLLCFLIKKLEPVLPLIVTNLITKKRKSLKWYFKAISGKRILIVSEVKVNGNSHVLLYLIEKNLAKLKSLKSHLDKNSNNKYMFWGFRIPLFLLHSFHSPATA